MACSCQRATVVAIAFITLAGCGSDGGSPAPVNIGGSVTGLAGSGLVLRDNGADNLPVTKNGTFVFSTPITANAQYNVTVAVQPTNPTQNCVVTHGSGGAGSGAVTTVAIQCTTSQFAVGGTVSGLSGQGLVLSDGGDALSISADGSFAFANTVASGSAYIVAVTTQPGNPMQNCTVTNGIGKVTDAAVTNVSVSCKAIGRFAYVLTNANPPTQGTNYGIWASTIDPVTGAFSMTSISPYAAGEFPSHVAATPNTKFVYATSWDSGGLLPDIYAYAIDPTTGALAAVPGMPFAAASLGAIGQSSSGAIAIDPQNRFLYVLASNVILAYTISAVDGSLAPISGSPFSSGSQLDSIVVDPSGQFVYVADTGSNQISAYVIDAATGALRAAPGSPVSTGSMPKSIAVDSTGRFVYLNTGPSNSISAYQINSSTGALSAVAGSPFATSAAYAGDPGPVAADPNSGLLFLESTGTADLSVVGIDSTTGALTVLSGQSEIDLSPGGFGVDMHIDPSGKFAYILNSNQPSDSNIAGFTIDSTTGNFTRLANLVWETNQPYFVISFAVTH